MWVASLPCAGRTKHAYVETSFPPVMANDDTQVMGTDEMDRICQDTRELLEAEIPERPVVGNCSCPNLLSNLAVNHVLRQAPTCSSAEPLFGVLWTCVCVCVCVCG